MNETLEKLNQAASDTAKAKFLDCCGSNKWAQTMVEARPFADVATLLEQAEQIWQNLEPQDWHEAFAAHPKIGSSRTAPKQPAQSAEWSRSEQSGTHATTDSVLCELAEANRLYEEKFGYIFIVRATGKTAEEMLANCRKRLNNDAAGELRIASDEQRKITETRLKKLLES